MISQDRNSRKANSFDWKFDPLIGEPRVRQGFRTNEQETFKALSAANSALQIVEINS
jgi:hypothetical protein